MKMSTLLLTEAWLGHDHYKWRAMRTNGISEQYITGDASEREKFDKWCETMPYLIGNPLLHWTHLELQRYFDIDLVINKENAAAIWEESNKKLATPEYSARNLLRRMNVESLCTTDDPLSDLEHHRALAAEGFEIKVLPTFRADDLFYIENTSKFLNWIERLATKTDLKIDSINHLFSAIEQRFNYFHEHGCRLSDIGIKVMPYVKCTIEEANTVFCKVLAGKPIEANEIEIFKTQIFHFLGVKNNQFGWTMQMHIGVLQDPNQRRFEEIGPATGMSAMDDQPIAKNLACLLSDLALIGAFQDSDSVPGKIQFGSAWWFNDQKDGMLNQIKMLGNMGMLGRFIGMLTDSRSLLSMPRHEYFRRILCNLIGQWVEDGEVPNDEVMLKEMVEGICYYNAKQYFNL